MTARFSVAIPISIINGFIKVHPNKFIPENFPVTVLKIFIPQIQMIIPMNAATMSLISLLLFALAFINKKMNADEANQIRVVIGLS